MSSSELNKVRHADTVFSLPADHLANNVLQTVVLGPIDLGSAQCNATVCTAIGTILIPRSCVVESEPDCSSCTIIATTGEGSERKVKFQ